MRRSLGLAAALASLVRAAPALGEPLDTNLLNLGVPDANVICALRAGTPCTPTAADYQASADARQRFAVLVTRLGLALDSAILAPPSTVGHSGFEFALEGAYVPASFDRALFAGFSPFKAQPPDYFLLPALHVRKALPYSFELGARAIYLDKSVQFATQLELKWAVLEGFGDLPDVAVRASLTRLFGIQNLDLGSWGLDAMVGKRFGIDGVLSLTPYGAFRFTWLEARSGPMQYANASSPPPAGSGALQTVASFPDIDLASHRFMRATLGVRLLTAAVVVSAEGTYTLSRKFESPAPDNPGATDSFEVPATLAAAVNLGLSF